MKQSIGGWDGQSPSDHNRTTDILNALDFPIPPGCPVMEVAGKGRPRHIGQGRIALLPGLEMAGVNRAVEFLQSFSGGSLGELGNWGSGAVA
jgi:hypothetical protein